MRAYVFFHNWKSIRCIDEFFCIVHTTLPRIQWCNFCIENPNLDSAFVLPILLYIASRILGLIKHTIRTAPEKSKLLAYTSLCRPIMESADILWDHTDKWSVDSLEKIQSKQSKAVRFIRHFKGRKSVTEAKAPFGLIPLADWRKNHLWEYYRTTSITAHFHQGMMK